VHKQSCYISSVSFNFAALLNVFQAFPVMMGEVEPNGNLNANIIHQFTKNLRCKFISQVQSCIMLI